MLIPSSAEALPVVAFVAGLGVAAGTAVGIAAAAAFPTIFAIGSFFGGTILGNLLLQVGLSYLLTSKPDAPAQPDLDTVRLNSRTSTPPRFQIGGSVAAGGAAGIFAEFDEDGNFWYIVAHGDAEMTSTNPSYILDGIEVTLSDGTDGFTAGDVLTDDFCLDGDGNVYESGTRNPYFRIYTVTPTSSSVVGVKPTAFTDAFPSLPADFNLAGVSYSIIRVKSVELKDRANVYRWRGAIGIGEPSITIVANFSRMYDPRNKAHDIADSSTWTATDGNSAIIWAWWRTTPFGRGRSMSEVDWDKVAAAANVCDETVVNRSGEDVSRYRCGIAAEDTTERAEVEAEILRTCDGFVAYSDTGLAYPVVGTYEEPSLSFSAERDIITSRTEIIDDGEAAVDGVVVRYVSPLHGYTKQESAPWQNPNYYTAGVEPTYRFIDILGCQDHNQAFRLAGAIGARVGASNRAALGCNIKGILAKSHRSINLSLDTDFTGVYEIATPVEASEDGAATAFAVVPLASDRWDGAGQTEGTPPAIAPALDIDTDLAVATNVVVVSESVLTETGSAVRLSATFDAPARLDRLFQFRYAPDGTTEYEYFTVDMDELRAYSAIVKDGQAYDVQWQTATGGGRASGWAADVGGGETVLEITAIANQTPPANLVAGNAVAGGAGAVDFTWTTANDANQYSVVLYIGTTTTFSAATMVQNTLSGPNVSASHTETGVASGTVYCWLVPANGSGVEGNEDGPYTVTVT
tara:strand:- start:3025 stop:5262 length:2238 start_codon:yes stop_codon:yes gene_type:complete